MRFIDRFNYNPINSYPFVLVFSSGLKMSSHSRTKSLSLSQQPPGITRDHHSGMGHKKRNLSFHLPAKTYIVSMDDSNSGESSVDNDTETYRQYGSQDITPWNPQVEAQISIFTISQM